MGGSADEANIATSFVRGGATSAVEVTAGEDMIFGALQAGAKIEDINAMGVNGALEIKAAKDAEFTLSVRNAAQAQQQLSDNITASINANNNLLIEQSNASLTSIAEQDQAIGQGGTTKVAFGFENEARSLADKIGGVHLMDNPNWKNAALDIFNSPSKYEVHFSLNGVDQTPMNMINSPLRSSTNWEMHQLYQSPAFENTTFYYGQDTYTGFGVFRFKP